MANNTHEATHGGAEAAGMPQLDFSTFGNQIFWLVVTLIVIYLVLTKIALPRIEAVLSDRQDKITNDLAAAEELKQKAVDAEDAYNKALVDARNEASKIVAEARAEIQVELDVAAAKADAEIAAKLAESEVAISEIRESSLESIKEVSKEATKGILSAMGYKADARSVTSAINARLKGDS